MTPNAPMHRNYVAVVTSVLLALTLWGFSDNLLWNTGQPSNSDPKFVIHGIFCLAWMVLLSVQATLVRTRRIAVHRRLGVLGAIVALGVVASTAYVFWAVRRPWRTMSVLVQANRGLMLGFALLVVLGLVHRARPAFHRRYLLLASFFMLEPVLSRAFDPLEPLLTHYSDAQIDVAWWWFFVLTWSALFASLVVHDRVVDGRVHEATRLGVALFVFVWLTVLVL